MVFTEDQVSVVELPTTMDVDPSVRVGAAGTLTAIKVTVVVGEVPAASAQVSEYVYVPVAVGVTI